MSFILLGILNSQAAGAGGAGGYDLLETTALTSSASSVSFTGLDSYTDYKHLQIRLVGQGNDTVSSQVRIRFNGDSTSGRYAAHQLAGRNFSGSYTVVSASNTSNNGIFFGYLPGNTTANKFGGQIIDILDFSSSSKATTIRRISAGEIVSPSDSIELSSGLYTETSAITSVELNLPPNFVAGSRFSLYGIKG